MIEQRNHIFAELRQRHFTIFTRGAMTVGIVAQHAKMLRQRLDLRLPHRPGGAQRVRENDDRRVLRPVNLIINIQDVAPYIVPQPGARRVLSCRSPLPGPAVGLSGWRKDAR